MKSNLRSCFLVLAMIGWAACSGQPSTRGDLPPNLVVIMFDDLGYNDLGCYYQPTPEAVRIDTPNIDRLAAQGVRFTNFYAPAPVCTASRAAFLTGSYPPRIGLSRTDSDDGFVLDMRSRLHLNPNDTTIAEILKAKGYATACIGKWHLGREGDGLPTRHGFAHYYGAIFRSVEGNRMMMDDEPDTSVEDSRLTETETQEAVRFIKRNQNRPFFLFLSHWMPHVPLAVRESMRGRSERGLYGDVVTELDWAVGEIIEALRTTGVSENTIVIVTSDNGPAVRHETDGGNSYPLRGGKRSNYEGGYRIPFLVSWPGTFPAGKTCDAVATLMDILPTMISITGAYVPRYTHTDGHNIRKIIQSPDGAKSPYDAFYYYNRNELEAVRANQWKLIFPRAEARRDDRRGDAGLQLFNLKHDPGETRNVAARNGHVVERLTRLADRMREDLGDDNLGIPGANRGHPGGIPDDSQVPPYEFDR